MPYLLNSENKPRRKLSLEKKKKKGFIYGFAFYKPVQIAGFLMILLSSKLTNTDTQKGQLCVALLIMENIHVRQK